MDRFFSPKSASSPTINNDSQPNAVNVSAAPSSSIINFADRATSFVSSIATASANNNNNNNNNNDDHPPAASSPLTSSMNRLQSEAKSVFDKLQGEVDKLGDKVMTTSIGVELDRIKNSLVEQAERFREEKLQMIKEFEKEKKQMLVRALSQKLVSAISVLMNIIVVKIKDGVDDPYMPRWIKKLIDTLIDAVWPDIAEDIKEQIFSLAHPKKPVDHGEPPCCYNQCHPCCCCCSPLPAGKSVPTVRANPDEHNCCVTCCCGLCYPNCYFEYKSNCSTFYGFLAWFRYTMTPYDRSIWRQLRDPSWWLLTLIAVIPKYGISQIYYFIWFLCMDRSDEFQLLSFIKGFKCLQFVALGVISAAVGGAQLFICTLPSPWLCPKFAPREELFALILFCSQIFLVWIAFCFLSGAKNKGGLYHQLSQAKASKLREEARDAKGTLLAAMAQEAVEDAFFESRADDTEGKSRLYALLIYDTVVFLICIGLCVFAAFYNLLDPAANVQNFEGTDSFWDSDNWKFVMTLYWVKCLYGLAAFPFVMLQIPGVSALFSHAKPTGYNNWGNIVPAVGVEEEDGDLPWRISCSHDGGAGANRKNDHEVGLVTPERHPVMIQTMDNSNINSHGGGGNMITAQKNSTVVAAPAIPPPPLLQQQPQHPIISIHVASVQHYSPAHHQQPQWGTEADADVL